MQLQSDAFRNGGAIPKRFTCDGENISPALSWTGAPPEAQSFAIICRDPDAPGGTWYHWAIFDLPRDFRALAEAYASARVGSLQARNDFGASGYGGPCPPQGHGDHHYVFTLYALNTPKLDIATNANCRSVERAAKSHAIAVAELTGLYRR